MESLPVKANYENFTFACTILVTGWFKEFTTLLHRRFTCSCLTRFPTYHHANLVRPLLVCLHSHISVSHFSLCRFQPDSFGVVSMTESISVVHYVTPKRTHTGHLLRNNRLHDTHVAPLGLWVVWVRFSIHMSPRWG